MTDLSPTPPPSAPPLLLTYNSPQGVPGHWTNISIHRPDDSQFWRTYLRNLGLQLLLRLPRLAIILGLWWWFYPYNNMLPEIQHVMLITLAVTIPASLMVGILIRYQRERKAFSQMEIVIADQGVLRRGGGIPALELTRDEIKKIEDRPTGLALISHPSARWIHVHRALLGFSDISLRLASWTEIPFTRQTRLRRAAIQGLVFLLAILSGSAVVGFLVGNTLLRSLALAYLLGAMGWAVRIIAQSPNLTPFQKTRSYISIGLIIVYLAAIYTFRLYHAL